MNLKEKTLKMKRWAVVGATNNQSRYGYKIIKILQEHEYDVYPINPRITDIDSIICYDSILDLDMEIDVVDMVVNPKIGIEVMKEIYTKGIKYVWLQPGTRSDEIRRFASDHGIHLIEDCIYATLS